MKRILLLSFTILFLSCGTKPAQTSNKTVRAESFPIAFNATSMEEHLNTLTSNRFNGRKTGEEGQKLAAEFLANYYRKIGLPPPPGQKSYFQTIPRSFLGYHSKNSSENVMAFLKGAEKPDEYIIITAHYDHLGSRKGKIYSGADDNASGTAALMEIAQNFTEAHKRGQGPKRSVLFLHLTGEEAGLLGSKYYVSHPVFPLENTMVNLNIDMIGRVDQKHEQQPGYVYLIGSDKMSNDLHRISEETNRKYVGLQLDYTYNNENDPNRYYYRSDQYSFVKNGIPAIFYFNGIHSDYHKPTDTADKINYNILNKRTELIFYTAWKLANLEKTLKID